MESIYVELWGCCSKFFIKIKSKTSQINVGLIIKNKKLLLKLPKTLKKSHRSQDEIKITSQAKTIHVSWKIKKTCTKNIREIERIEKSRNSTKN